MRAFAVVIVVLDHLLGWPSGGFIGVDVFFVISGFLITGLLLREHEKTGRISFGNFYRRRIKRILPASTMALAGTLIGAFLIFGTGRFTSTLKDAAAALFFGANWRFAATGTDYFLANGPVSPLQHFWSLSVEEQFYFVWPVVMLLVLSVALRRGGSRDKARLLAGIAIVVISLASLGWALWESQALPTRAYFSTFSRIWELGVGAALAIAAPLASRIPSRWRPGIAWLGIAILLVGLFRIDSGSAFPAPWAALPVLGTAVVILAGTGIDRHPFLWPLTNPVSGYVGNISYSLYLWHFPVIILTEAVLVERTVLFFLVTTSLMLLLAVFSYHLVENPVRRSTWLSGSEARAKARNAPRKSVPSDVRIAGIGAAATVLVVTLLLPLVPVQARNIELVGERASDVSEETAELQEQIRTALGATQWPELDPTIDQAMAGAEASADITACGGIGPVVIDDCTWGDPEAEQHAVVVGDSIAMTWAGPLRDALGTDDGWDLTSLGTFGCTFTDLLIENPDPVVVNACEDRKAQAVDAINQLQPDVVFIANTYEPRFPAGWNEAMTPEEWKDSMQTIVAEFRDSVQQVVFLAPPPLYTDISDCYSRIVEPSFCAGTVESQWRTFAVVEQELADSMDASFVDPELWFCAEDWCPSFVGTVPTKRDLVHMTPAYQSKIAPALRAELLDQGLLAP